MCIIHIPLRNRCLPSWDFKRDSINLFELEDWQNYWSLPYMHLKSRLKMANWRKDIGRLARKKYWYSIYLLLSFLWCVHDLFLCAILFNTILSKGPSHVHSPPIFQKFVTKFWKCLIMCPYLESAWKMHHIEYKHAYVWSSGSWDNMWYIHKQDDFFPLNDTWS